MRLLYSITAPNSGSLNLSDRKAKQYRVINYHSQEVVGENLDFDEARLMTVHKTEEAHRLARILGEEIS